LALQQQQVVKMLLPRYVLRWRWLVTSGAPAARQRGCIVLAYA